MSNSIGKYSLHLGVDSAKLDSGLNKAEKTVSAWVTKLNDRVSFIGDGLTGKLAALGTSIQDGLGKAIGEVFDRADQIDKWRQATGLAAETLTALQYAASQSGTDFETLTKGIGKLNGLMSDLRSGSKEAAGTLARFGVSGQALASGTVDGALLQIASAMDSLQDPVDKVGLAMAVFGDKAGPSLVPLLGQGEKGIRSLMAEAKRLGVTRSDSQVDKLGAAGDAVARLGAAWTGIKQTLVIELAPIVEKIADALTNTATGSQASWKSLGESIASTLLEALKASAAISSAVGSIADRIPTRAIQVTMDTMQQPLNALRQLGDLAGGGGDQGGGSLTKLGDELSKAAVKIEAGMNAVNQAKTKVKTPAVDVAALNLTQSVGQVTAKLAEQIATAGMSADALTRHKLASEGATAAQLRMVDALIQQKVKLDEQARAVAAAKSQLDSLIQSGVSAVPTSPFDAWHNSLAGLNAALQAGRISWQQYEAGVAQAAQTLMGAANAKSSSALMLPQSMDLGSKEAREFHFRASQPEGLGGRDSFKNAWEKLKEQVKATTDAVKELLNEIRKGGDQPVF